MKLYNKNQIVSVQTFKEERDNHYEFLPKKDGFFGLGQKEEGVYHIPFMGAKPVLMLVLPKDHFRKGNSIYWKPKIVITYSNNEKQIEYFNNMEEIDVYIKREFYEAFWRKEF